MKQVIYILILFLIASCNLKKKEERGIINYVIDAIEKNELGGNNYLILYISELMCSECINKELINISADSLIQKKLIIVGAFSKQRYFFSNINQIKPSKKIYIQLDEQNGNVFEKSPIFYCTYNDKTKYISNYFYPQVCEEGKTLDYFNSIKKYLQN